MAVPLRCCWDVPQWIPEVEAKVLFAGDRQLSAFWKPPQKALWQHCGCGGQPEVCEPHGQLFVHLLRLVTEQLVIA